MRRSSELIILPSLRGRLLRSGKIVVTEKFVEGVRLYAQHWPGRVTAILHPRTDDYSGNLDNVEVEADHDGLSFRVIPFDSPDLLESLKSAALVQGGADYLLNHVPDFCQAHRIPYVFVCEYTLRTRCQIIAAETSNPLLRARRYMWEWNQERRNRRNVTLSAGVQCNGTPTFDAYKELNQRTLLYFDTRVDSSMFSGSTTVESRVDGLRQGKSIRLAFSGRLHKMKGADHLPLFAAHLRELGIPFELDICGDGPLFDQIQKEIEQRGLADQVRLRGNLDFAGELVPFIKSEIDLFVCCHRQGDPSCTYLETLACGVPIAGYANEAFAGLLRECGAGWKAPLNRPEELARVVASVYRQPERIADAARAGLSIAREHLADAVFARRVSHMRDIASI